VEVPGVKKEDLAIECRENTISIRGEKKSQRDPDHERAYRMERRYGVLSRSLALPDDADLEHIQASFQDGILRIRIEKKPETKPRRIEIRG
jgi:HSP20 family protein